MKLGFTAIALAALLSSSPFLSPAALAQGKPPAVPDAPTPQAPKPLSSDAIGPITPGKGAGETPSGPSEPGSSSTSTVQQPVPGSLPPSSQGKDTIQTAPPQIPAARRRPRRRSPPSSGTPPSSKSRSPSRTRRASWWPASPTATSRSTRTTPASQWPFSPPIPSRFRSPLSSTRA